MTRTVELPIGGMTCAACATRIGRGLNGLEGAAEANVNAINFDGETPLDCATNFSQNEIAAIPVSYTQPTLPTNKKE